MIEYVRRESEDAKQELEYVRQKLDDVKRGIKKARQEEELEKVHEEGRKEGLAAGREEERRILIKSLYDNGIAVDTIAVSVGLSEPAIRRMLDDE